MNLANVELRCFRCAIVTEFHRLSNEPRAFREHLDSGTLGYLVAARPTDDGTFWSHASGPPESVAAWVALPLFEARR